jgi:uncharacterized membrane protein
MAEQQGEHRRNMEQRALEAQIEGMHRQFDEARRGQVFAFCVAVLFLAGGTYTISHGQALADLFSAPSD